MHSNCGSTMLPSKVPITSTKKYWNQVFLDGDVDDKLLKQLIDHSMEEVLKKFTKKMRTEYEALP